MVLVWTFLATLGFAVLFQCRGWPVVWAALGGALGWGVYLGASALGSGDPVGYALAAALVTLWSETLARFMKKPAVSFLLPGLIPLVPGKAVFTTMDLAVRNRLAEAAQSGYQTLVIAAALVVGVAAVTVLVRSRRLGRSSNRQANRR